MAGAQGGHRSGAGRPPGSANKLSIMAKATITELAQAHTETALQTLIDVMKPGNPAAARVSAANIILDRGHGKPREAAQDSDAMAASLNITITTAAPIGEIRVTRSDP